MPSKIVLGGRFEVFDDGRVNRIRNGVPEPAAIFYTSRNGKYCMVSYTENGIQHRAYVHRLVAQAFVPNPDQLPQVNHIDGDTRNNAASNLAWVTPKQNIRHAYETGLLNPMATAHPCDCCGAFTRSKLSYCPSCQRLLKTEAREMDRAADLHDRYSILEQEKMSEMQKRYVKARAAGLTLSEIALKYGVSRQAVSASLLNAERKCQRSRPRSHAKHHDVP